MLLGKLAVIYKILNKNKPYSFHSASFMAVSLSIVHLSLSFTVIVLCGFYDRENDSKCFSILMDSPYKGSKGKLEIQ